MGGPGAVVWLRGLVVVLLCAGVGAALARLAEGRREPWASLVRGLSPLGWAPASLLAASLAFAAFLQPIVLASELSVLFVLSRTAVLQGVTWSPPSFAVGREEKSVRTRRRWVLVGLVVAIAAAASYLLRRPLVPLYWDEYVWLGKARLAARGVQVLREAALDPASTLVPPGYPLLWPFVVGALTAHHDDVAALVAGGHIVVVVAAAAYVHEALATAKAERKPGWAVAAMVLVLVASPLVFVHARLVYVDLPTGFLAGALALRLARTVVADADDSALPLPSALPSVAYALTLTGTKDEGFVHVLAVLLVPAIFALRRRSARLGIAVVEPAATALLLFAAWRGLLSLHGVVDEDHALGLSALRAAPMLASVWLVHLLDLASWGLLWPLAAGAVLVNATARGADAKASVSRLLSFALCADVVALFLGVVTCPERVHEFAAEGTLVGRLLVQHAPLAAGALGLALAERLG